MRPRKSTTKSRSTSGLSREWHVAALRRDLLPALSLKNVADRAASVVLVVCLQGVTTWIMTKKGLFFCALNLPLVTAGCAVVFQTSRQLVQLVAAMACLKAFTQLNFGFTRTLWYAVPDAVRTLAYAVIGDFVRFETFSVCHTSVSPRSFSTISHRRCRCPAQSRDCQRLVC